MFAPDICIPALRAMQRQFGDRVLGNSAGSVTLNDGTLRAQTGDWTSSRQINLAGNGTIEAATGALVTWNGPVTGSGAHGIGLSHVPVINSPVPSWLSGGVQVAVCFHPRMLSSAQIDQNA